MELEGFQNRLRDDQIKEVKLWQWTGYNAIRKKEVNYRNHNQVCFNK